MEKDTFRHVLWIGGSPCAGKSSIANLLAAKYSLAAYHCDDMYDQHKARANAKAHPTFYRLSRMSGDALWMRPVDLQIAEAIRFHREEFGMVLEDLAAMPSATPVIAEGTSLLPTDVSALVPDRSKAIWLVPAAAFQIQHYARRPWVRDVLAACTHPEQSFQNWMERDVGFAMEVAAEARDLGLHLLEVDGTLSLAEVAGLVEEHFGLK